MSEEDDEEEEEVEEDLARVRRDLVAPLDLVVVVLEARLRPLLVVDVVVVVVLPPEGREEV